MKTVHLIISGLVQGVYFRKSTQEQAIVFSLTGWVRNLENGNVECVATGSPEAINLLIRWCAKGPDAARVDNVGVSEMPEVQVFDGFEIRR